MVQIRDRLVPIRQALYQERPLRGVLGFDGFIDEVVRVVERYEDGQPRFFQKMDDLARFLQSRAGKSCGLECKTQVKKAGGNAPLMAMALKKLSMEVSLIGALGDPEPHPLLEARLGIGREDLYCCAEPGTSTAIELQDGKIMMGTMDPLDRMGWEKIRQTVTLPVLSRLFSEADLVCLLNWSEVVRSSEIWRGLLEEVLPMAVPKKGARMCFDLSDCARRPREELLEMLQLMRSFRQYYELVLNVNQNEHNILHQAVLGTDAPERLEDSRLAERLGVDILCIHHHRGCVAFTDGATISVENYYVDQPVLQTGAGDNFNGGFAYALCCGMPLEDALIVGNGVSSYYVRRGVCPDREQLMDHLQSWAEVQGAQ